MSQDKKKLLAIKLLGEQGVALAKLLTLEMGSAWHETNSMLETGIDAAIELRDPETEVMLNRWLNVQSKAHSGVFKNETDDSFIFVCARRDLEYWIDGNTPVILIVSRPAEREAWWQPISTELLEVEDRAKNVELSFHKQRDAYGPQSYEALLRLASRDMKLPPDPWSNEDVKFQFTPTRIEANFLTLGVDMHVPAVPLGLSLPSGETFTTRALLDSGAESSSFPFEYASLLGIDLAECISAEMMTVGGSVYAYLSKRDLVATIFGIAVPLKPIFASTPVVVLGRLDFFTRFVVTIDALNKRFSLEPIAGEAPGLPHGADPN
jgi:hypothetical protein